MSTDKIISERKNKFLKKRTNLFCQPGDVYYDFFYFKYKPVSDTNNKLKPINLLLNSFEQQACGAEFYDFVAMIMKRFGRGKTVWGIKKVGDSIFWEFYFYNWEKKDKKINMSNFLKISKPFFRSEIKPNENIPYIMFSADVTKGLFSKRELNGLHTYIRKLTTCYFLDKTGTELENCYIHYNPKTEFGELIENTKRTTIIDFTKIKESDVLWPELVDCHTIVRAYKRKNDAIYYNRININQLLFFLKKNNYPKEIILFIEKNKTRLNHLLFDVGFDYIMENNKIKITKSGYYGIF
jgi:hypothetical protein